MAAAIAAMTGRLGRRRRSVVTVLAIVAYVAFAGASASVVRAALMAGVVLLARESGRAGRAAAALGWAATILLVSDPALIGDAGFQLSSLATAGLIAWATPLTDWLERRGRGRVPRWLAESLGVSLAAQAATLPIILVSFGRLAVLSPVVNLLVVPLVAPAMAAGVIALAGGALVIAGLPPVVGAVLAAPGWVILRVLVAIVVTAAGPAVRQRHARAAVRPRRGRGRGPRAGRADAVAEGPSVDGGPPVGGSPAPHVAGASTPAPRQRCRTLPGAQPRALATRRREALRSRSSSRSR